MRARYQHSSAAYLHIALAYAMSVGVRAPSTDASLRLREVYENCRNWQTRKRSHTFAHTHRSHVAHTCTRMHTNNNITLLHEVNIYRTALQCMCFSQATAAASLIVCLLAKTGL